VGFCDQGTKGRRYEEVVFVGSGREKRYAKRAVAGGGADGRKLGKVAVVIIQLAANQLRRNGCKLPPLVAARAGA
jgi:hypothetical protein